MTEAKGLSSQAHTSTLAYPCTLDSSETAKHVVFVLKGVKKVREGYTDITTGTGGLWG